MKTTLLTTLLALSIFANAALILYRKPSTATPSVAAVHPASPDVEVASTGPSGQSTAPFADKEVGQLVQAWQRLKSGDIKTLIDQMRVAGFSESMIRSIVAAQVSDQFTARRKALIAHQEEAPYWTAQRGFGLDPKTMAALRELSRAQNEQIKSLLGPEGVVRSEEMQVYQRRQFGELAPDKIDQIQSIVSDYSELRQQIYANANGVILSEDREKLSLLEKEQQSDLAGILTPQEIENYELRSSSTANLLRSQLGAFKPTEDEFRAIFRATRAAEEQYGAISGGGSVGGSQVRQVQAAVLEQTKAFLPPERYAALQQATDPAYQLVNRLVARLDLPAEAATQIVAVQQDITKRAGALRTDQSLSPEQRAVQLSGLLQEATSSLTNALGGARGLDAYKQYGGQWLQNLQPRTATPPKG